MNWTPAAITALMTVIAGCASAPVIVKVPVPVRAQAPEAVTRPLAPKLPVFVAPATPAVTSCLTAEGERALKELIQALNVKVRACEAWADEEPQQPGDRRQ